jgi:hypothetical protein
MIVTPIAVWAFDAGSGTTISANVGGPSIQSFGSAGGWSSSSGQGYRVQYNAAPNATGSALITGVHGASKLIVGHVIRPGSALPNTGEALHGIGQDENSLGNMRVGNWCGGSGSDVRFRFNGSDIVTGTSTTMSAGTLYRSWSILDTPNATAASRGRFYWQGSQTGTTGAITQNATVSIDSGTDELITGCPFGAGTISNAGYTHWLFYGTFDTFSESDLLAADTAIAADNDLVAPFSGGGGGGYIFRDPFGMRGFFGF